MFNVTNRDQYFIVGRTPSKQPVEDWESVQKLPVPAINEIKDNRRIAEQLNAADKELPGNLTEFILDVEDLGRYGREVFFRAGFKPDKEVEQPYALLLGKEGGHEDIGGALYTAIEERKLKPVMERIFQNVTKLKLVVDENPVFIFENPFGEFELKIFDYKERFLKSLSGNSRSRFAIKSLSGDFPLQIVVRAEGVEAPEFLTDILRKNNLDTKMKTLLG
jgi:hypothetical protein